MLLRVIPMGSDADFVAKAFAGWYGGEPALSDALRRAVGPGASMAAWACALAAVVAA